MEGARGAVGWACASPMCLMGPVGCLGSGDCQPPFEASPVKQAGAPGFQGSAAWKVEGNAEPNGGPEDTQRDGRGGEEEPWP